jgi:hypothetical protein
MQGRSKERKQKNKKILDRQFNCTDDRKSEPSTRGDLLSLFMNYHRVLSKSNKWYIQTILSNQQCNYCFPVVGMLETLANRRLQNQRSSLLPSTVICPIAI